MPLICQLCQQRPATVHVTELGADGTRQEAHLCQTCIREHGLDLAAAPPPLASLAQAVEGVAASAAAPAEAAEAICPGCGLRFSEYTQNNLFGCPECYQAFDRQVADLALRHHGALRHCGRLPAGAEAPPPAPRRRAPGRAELERRLQEAVAAERFEEAAALRDQLRAAGPDAGPGVAP